MASVLGVLRARPYSIFSAPGEVEARPLSLARTAQRPRRSAVPGAGAVVPSDSLSHSPEPEADGGREQAVVEGPPHCSQPAPA